MSTLPIARGNAPLCACGCGHRTSTVRTEYILGHRPRRDPAVRFWEKVGTSAGPDACWPWMGYLYRNGYAMFTPDVDGPKVMAHRYAYELARGPIPGGLTIDHLCGTRSCCNPAHMEPVTRGENSRRGGGLEAAIRRRGERAARECPEGHPRTPEHARRGPDGHWRCKTCRREKRARGEWQ